MNHVAAISPGLSQAVWRHSVRFDGDTETSLLIIIGALHHGVRAHIQGAAHGSLRTGREPPAANGVALVLQRGENCWRHL